jgi:hypothetical protein
MITVVPMGPEIGVKLVMVGIGAPTVKFEALKRVEHPIVTSKGPDVAPTGIVTVNVVAVDDVMVAVMPLILTVLLKGVLKLVPVIVTDVPIGPEVGVKEVIVGGEMRPFTLSSTDTFVVFVTMSLRPSPSISAMNIASPIGKVMDTREPNEPVLITPTELRFLKIDMKLVPAPTRSIFASPSKSARLGPPAGPNDVNSTLDSKDKEPDELVFLKTANVPSA